MLSKTEPRRGDRDAPHDNNHQQRNAFSQAGLNGIGTDIRFNAANKGFYNVGIAAKIPLITASSDNGDVCFLAILLWSKAM